MTDADFKSMCEGKEGHTHARAREIAARMNRNKSAGVSAYRCHCCGEWHIGRLSDSRIKRVGS